MRRLGLIAFVALLGCREIPTAADFLFPDGDGFAAAWTDAAEGVDGSEMNDGGDTGIKAEVADVYQGEVGDAWSDPCSLLNCNDNNVCTTDSCVGTNGCTHVNNTLTCDDGNACTASDVCGAGVCKGVAPICGDGTCECGETSGTCAVDCMSVPPAGMVLIPAAAFWMGCNYSSEPSCASNEKPQHKVVLSAYYMDLNEATVKQYKACVDDGKCKVPSKQSPTTNATYPALPNNPVNFIGWTEARQYCKWRGVAYDLPTEAQWEMAARGSCDKNGSVAGDATCAAAMRTYPWGGATASCGLAVMSNGTDAGCGTKATWAVGSKTAGDSPYGIHDMAGNVWEWTRDWYSPTAYGNSVATDPVNESSASFRVIRGGSFVLDAAGVRAGLRSNVAPSYSDYDLGLRCVKSFP